MVVTDDGESGGDTMGDDDQDGGELRKSLLEHTEGVVVFRGGELKKSLLQTDGVVVFRGGDVNEAEEPTAES